MLGADLIVFAASVYVLRSPGQVKALLDHFGCHWMSHRPDHAMFSKHAAIITQSVGAPNGGAQKYIATSMTSLDLPSPNAEERLTFIVQMCIMQIWITHICTMRRAKGCRYLRSRLGALLQESISRTEKKTERLFPDILKTG
jgi:multimeric flavodoxin WrbA